MTYEININMFKSVPYIRSTGSWNNLIQFWQVCQFIIFYSLVSHTPSSSSLLLHNNNNNVLPYTSISHFLLYKIQCVNNHTIIFINLYIHFFHMEALMYLMSSLIITSKVIYKNYLLHNFPFSYTFSTTVIHHKNCS